MSISSYKTQRYKILRDSLPLKPIKVDSDILWFEDYAVFHVFTFQTNKEYYKNEKIKFYNIFQKRVFEIKQAENRNLIFTKIFIIRRIFQNAIKHFYKLICWQVLFEDHYIMAMNAQNCKPCKMIMAFFELADSYLLQNINLVFSNHKILEYFFQKYPKDVFMYGYQKSKLCWIDTKIANIINDYGPRRLKIRMSAISAIFSKIFTSDISILIVEYSFIPEYIVGKTFIEYFLEIYDFQNECIKEKYTSIVKSVKRKVVINEFTQDSCIDTFVFAYIDTFDVKLIM